MNIHGDHLHLSSRDVIEGRIARGWDEKRICEETGHSPKLVRKIWADMERINSEAEQAPAAPVPPIAASVRVDYVRTLLPCGTHAAFVRHKSRKEQPCDECREGEREYQADRQRGRRAQSRKAAA